MRLRHEQKNQALGYFRLSFCVLLQVVLSFAVVEGKASVCIIGAGDSGASTAYFLRDFVKEDEVEIQMFEKNDHIGGRASDFLFEGQVIEAGASIVQDSNRYFIHSAARLGLEMKKAGTDPDDTFGIFDGTDFIFKESPWQIATLAKLFWKFGMDLFRMNNLVKDFVKKFTHIYEIQDQGKAFHTPEELYETVGVYNLTQQTLAHFLESNGIKPALINEFATAINRVNYGQNSTLNGFAGLVGLAGSGSELQYLEGGNKQLFEQMIDTSQAIVHLNTEVTRIVGTTAPYKIITSKAKEFTCDAVVVAAPFELSRIQIESEIADQLELTKYQLTETTFVTGKLKSSFFGKDENLPGTILTTETPNQLFNSISRKPVKGANLYKIFSREPLTENALSTLFEGYEVVKIYPWRAYPTFHPPESFSPFYLSKNFVYVNAMERGASAMEIMLVAGRNAALLLKESMEITSSPTLKFSDASNSEL